MFQLLPALSLLSTSVYRDTPGYVDPADNGGASLAYLLSPTYPPGQREPLNIIISGKSDPAVLEDQINNGGLKNYFLSLNFSTNCFSAKDVTAVQVANLGDGNGDRNQTEVMRYNFGNADNGACTEVIDGGNHFRYWRQNGSDANTGAVFIASSYEFPLDKSHDIVPNGYNLGRDYIVGNITKSTVPTLDLTQDGARYSGATSYGGYTYNTTINYVSGLLSNTSIGINHNATVEIPGVTNAVDGLVAVFEVSITGRPDGTTASPANSRSMSASATTSGGSEDGTPTTYAPSLAFMYTITGMILTIALGQQGW
ncbi:hypothetical protein CYLTODRAFT_417903 [Cylindrobasidium torrendii FP15055 ss-10]|uniref:Uncharacterized protein n=1 Tax=Cylindrobasidium torrendii FP15055 ss-10 TaxID=1314674 RepID=A0A0D7BQJ9_9AGAR|nr:hypothetical protein CYLTODRAFT_417903 [Cylindrobasidium torrendii FP15055 ss-10]